MIGLTPDISEARAVSHGVLAVTFADGLQGEVEVLERMRGPVFETARTSEASRESRSTAKLGRSPGPAERTSRPTPSTNAYAPGPGPTRTWPPDHSPPRPPRSPEPSNEPALADATGWRRKGYEVCEYRAPRGGWLLPRAGRHATLVAETARLVRAKAHSYEEIAKVTGWTYTKVSRRPPSAR